MPFCRITLRAKKPLSQVYPKILNTVGDHLRKRRLDLKLFQKDVAKILGVQEATVWDWENNYYSPSINVIPRLVQFLGYIPFALHMKTTGDTIIAYRRLQGLSQKKLAKQLGVDPSTLARWERNDGKPYKDFLTEVITFFKTTSCPVIKENRR